MLSPHGCSFFSTPYWSPPPPSLQNCYLAAVSAEPQCHCLWPRFRALKPPLPIVRLQYICFSPQQLTDLNVSQGSRCADSVCAVCLTWIVTQAVFHVRAGVEIPAWRGSVYARPVATRITSYCAQLRGPGLRQCS